VTKQVRILIADSHDVVRRSLRLAVEEQAAWIVCGEARTGLETLTRTIELTPDVVVLDVGLPGLNGLDVTREIGRVAPAVHVLALTTHPSRQLARRFHDAGARAYLLKSEAGRTLADSIHNAVGDQHARFSEYEAAVADDVPERPSTVAVRSGPTLILTSREREVLHLLAEGQSNKEVGIALTISRKTVETHRARIMGKLGLRSMGQLVRYAIRHGIINA
jgi:DNA-binding NarL/FixJ family response regulator